MLMVIFLKNHVMFGRIKMRFWSLELHLMTSTSYKNYQAICSQNFIHVALENLFLQGKPFLNVKICVFN